MEYQLEILKRILKPGLKDTYRIAVEFMHGDADKYETKYFTVKSKDEACLFYRLYDLHIDERDEDEEAILEVLKDFPAWQEEKNLLKYWPGDCTCDGMVRASIEDVTITYFDGHGIEHQVSITWDEEEEE